MKFSARIEGQTKQLYYNLRPGQRRNPDEASRRTPVHLKQAIPEAYPARQIASGPCSHLIIHRLATLVTSLSGLMQIALPQEYFSGLLETFIAFRDQRDEATGQKLLALLGAIKGIERINHNERCQRAIVTAVPLLNLCLQYFSQVKTIEDYLAFIEVARDHYDQQVAGTKPMTQALAATTITTINFPLPKVKDPLQIKIMLSSVFFFIGQCIEKPDTSNTIYFQKMPNATLMHFQFQTKQNIGQSIISGNKQATTALIRAAEVIEPAFKGRLYICQEENKQVTITLELPA